MSAAQPSPLPGPVRGVLRRFQAQRPLRAPSLLITIFGDAIAPRGGAIALGSLIRVAAPFGLAERAVRTAVARLARDGWLAARRGGRHSEYRLTRVGAARFAEATRRIYGQNPHSWNGRWTLVLLPPGRQRRARTELRWLGFGQLGPALLAHPACTLPQARAWLREVAGTRGALLLHSSGAGLTADRALVARGWDLAGLARRYARFLARFAALEPLLEAGAVSRETAFVVRTLLIHEYRRIHLQDPLLPPALLPQDWVGAAAYGLCRRLYARVFAPAEDYLSDAARRLSRPLPAANRAAHARFGGLQVRRVTALRARPPVDDAPRLAR